MHEGHWVSYFTVSWMMRDLGGFCRRTDHSIDYFSSLLWVIGSVLRLHVLVGSTGKYASNGWHQLCFVCIQFVWLYTFMCPLSYRQLYVKCTVISHKNKSREKETALSPLCDRASFFNTWAIGWMKIMKQGGLCGTQQVWPVQKSFQSFEITNN